MAKQALEGKRLNAFSMDPNDLTIVGLDTDDGAEHPLWQERVKNLTRTITAEWVKNILRLGVLEAVKVRKNGERTEVVAGRRRVLGCRKANEILLEAGGVPHRIVVMVQKATDNTAMESMIAENEGRYDDPPGVRARTAARYMQRGNTEEDVAVILGLHGPKQVKDLLKFLDLSDNVQKHVDEGRLALTAALTLTDLERAEQDTKAAEYIEKGVTIVEAKRQTKLRKSSTKPEGEAAEPKGKRPSIAIIRALTESEVFLSSLSEDARHLLHWFGGNEASARRVKGLMAKLRELGA